jgi:hypothetical protein
MANLRLKSGPGPVEDRNIAVAVNPMLPISFAESELLCSEEENLPWRRGFLL